MLPPPAPDLSAVSTLLLDADSTLVAAEEPSYAASARVRLQLLHRLGATHHWDVERLREEWRGRSFRRIACDLAMEEGVRLGAAELADWVDREERCVTTRLREAPAPDPVTADALARLAGGRVLAAVASSTSARIDACLVAAGLAGLLPPERRFSGEDSLALAASKPDPTVHLHAVFRLGARPSETVAVESTRCGVRAAVGAGLVTVGNLAHVPAPERAARRADLLAAGAALVVEDWVGLAALLEPADRPAEARPCRAEERLTVRVPSPRRSSRGEAGATVEAV